MADLVKRLRGRATYLTAFELGLLRQMCGLDDRGQGPTCWGAAVTAALEYLVGSGLVRPCMRESGLVYEPTERGREAASGNVGLATTSAT